MLVEIDDAGIGCPVGGIVLGGRKGDKYVFEEIPVEFFRDRELRKRLKEVVKEKIEKILENLGFNAETDEIFICQGDIFSKAIEWLVERGFNVKIGKIASTLQDYVESVFDLHLVKYGVPRNLLKRLKTYKDYTLELFKWVIVKMEDRERIVKSIYRSWRMFWSKAKIEKVSHFVKRRRFCTNCGLDIERGVQAYKLFIYVGGRKYIAYVHKECLDGELHES